MRRLVIVMNVLRPDFLDLDVSRKAMTVPKHHCSLVCHRDMHHDEICAFWTYPRLLFTLLFTCPGLGCNFQPKQQSETLHIASSTELRAQPYEPQPRTRIDQAPESLIGLPPIRYLMLRSSFLYTSRNHICVQYPTSVRP